MASVTQIRFKVQIVFWDLIARRENVQKLFCNTLIDHV